MGRPTLGSKAVFGPVTLKKVSSSEEEPLQLVLGSKGRLFDILKETLLCFAVPRS